MVLGTGVEPSAVTGCKDNNLQNSPRQGGAERGALSADSGPAAAAGAVDLPPDVADLARRLAALPLAVRQSLAAALGQK